MNHVVIKDNFLDTKLALKLRDLALSMEFTTSKRGIYSGRRTEDIKYTHKFLYNTICTNIAKIYNLDCKLYDIHMSFHITEGKFGDQGWVHHDIPSVLAGILYLNPSVNDITCGTSLYDALIEIDPLKSEESISTIRKSFKEGKDYLEEKNNYNSNFTKTAMIGGKFNRFVAYPSGILHAGEGYFGTSVEDSRLTLLVFFYKKR